MLPVLRKLGSMLTERISVLGRLTLEINKKENILKEDLELTKNYCFIKCFSRLKKIWVLF